MLFSAGSLQRKQGDACVVKKKVGRGESSGGDEPHDREGVGAEDAASQQQQQQQQQSQETDLNGAQNSHVSNVNDSSEGGGGTVTNAGNSNSTGEEEGGDLYDPFASTDSDTDNVSAKKALEAENRRNAENRKLEQQRHQEEEEESDEFSDIEPPPPEKKPAEEETRKERTAAPTGVTGQEKYDPMDPTDDPSPAPTPLAFTPMDDDDRSQDTDLSAPPFSPPSPGLSLAKDSLPNDDDDEEPMEVDEAHPKGGAAVAKGPNKERSRESEDEDPECSSTPDAPQNFDPPSLSEIPLPEG